MKLLITGGCGFIGSTFIKYILQKYSDYKIINLDALTYCGNLENLAEIEDNKNYRFVKGSINDRNLVEELIKESDCLINFAAESHVDNSIKAPEIFVETNVKGTLTLLQACKNVGIERFLQISTDEVYGSLGEKGMFRENSQLAPNSPYSASKTAADLFVKSYYETYKLPVLITRSSNNYGPYQYPEKLIPFFISKLLKNEKIPLYGDGLNIRDWIYVYDNCEAIDLVLHKGKIGEIYNIGGNNEKTNLEITKIILDMMEKDDSWIEYVQDRLGHDRRYSLCCSKLRDELGWTPKTSFERGIKDTVSWYLNNQKWINNINKKRTEAGF